MFVEQYLLPRKFVPAFHFCRYRVRLQVAVVQVREGLHRLPRSFGLNLPLVVVFLQYSRRYPRVLQDIFEPGAGTGNEIGSTIYYCPRFVIIHAPGLIEVACLSA
jgi:hypothetical protein